MGEKKKYLAFSLKNPEFLCKAAGFCVQKLVGELIDLIDRCFGLVGLYIFSFSRRKAIHNNKVLICRKNYADQRCKVPSNDSLMLDQTLFEYIDENHQQGVQFNTFHWDTGRIFFFRWRFIKAVSLGGYQSVIFSSYNPGATETPNIRLLKKIKSKLSSKFICIWWDTDVNNNTHQECAMRMMDVNIIADNPTYVRDGIYPDSIERKKVKYLWPPFPCKKRLTFLRHRERTINVSFIGRVNSYRSHRFRYIDHAMREGIGGYMFMSSNTSLLNYDELMSVLSLSKIGINFSQSTKPDHFQLKGRVFETMLCGAMLLESENDQTSQLFQKGVHYDTFSDEEELVEKANFYLENDQIRERIARAGHEKVLADYNSVKFWEHVFASSENHMHVVENNKKESQLVLTE